MPSIRKWIRHAWRQAETVSAGRALIGAAAALALCALAPAPAAAQGARDVVSYVNVPLQDWLPFWVAQQEDLGKPYNIALKAVPITGGTQTAEFAASGNADIATVAATLCLLAVK